jgi:hypothetical protein
MLGKIGFAGASALLVHGLALFASAASGQSLTYGLAGGNETWPVSARECVMRSMDEAVAIYNRYGHFDRHPRRTTTRA